MEQKTSLHRCKLVPSCSSWSISYVRSLLICSKCQCANETRVNLPKHRHCMFPCLPVLALPARSMLIYAHIFVDNLRDLIARRAAANCYLVRQLICQKIDSPLSEAVWPVPPEQRQLEQHLLPLADFGLVCRCRNFHLDRLPNCCKVKFALCLLQCPEVCIQYAYLDTKYNRLTYLTHLIRQRTATTRPSYLCSVRNKELPFTLMRIVRPSCPSSAQSFANLHFKARQIEQRQH